MSHLQSLKSAMESRVRQDRAGRIASEVQDLGHGEFCPAGTGAVNFDIFGRPASKNTLPTNLPYMASCSHYVIPARTLIAYENNTRPYISTCTPGLRGNSDMLGVSRNLLPDKLYGESARFVTAMGYPPRDPRPAPAPAWAYEPVQPYSGSMDATSGVWVR